MKPTPANFRKDLWKVQIAIILAIMCGAFTSSLTHIAKLVHPITAQYSYRVTIIFPPINEHKTLHEHVASGHIVWGCMAIYGNERPRTVLPAVW